MVDRVVITTGGTRPTPIEVPFREGIYQRPPWVDPNPGPPESGPTQNTVRDARSVQFLQTAFRKKQVVLFGPGILGSDRIIYRGAFGPVSGASNTRTYLYMVAHLCVGPIEQIVPVFEDEVYTEVTGQPGHFQDALKTIDVWTYKGLQTSVDPALNNADPRWQDPLTGSAYAVIRIKHDPALGRTEVPNTMLFKCKGYNALYDPRTATRGYSENWVLFWRELRTNTRWGLGTQVDDTLVSAAADICDDEIFPVAPTVAPTAVSSGVGVIEAGLYAYTFTNATVLDVETLQSPRSGTISVNANMKVKVTVPAGDANTTQRFVYRNRKSEPVTMPMRRVGVVTGAASVDFFDNMNDAELLLQPLAPTTQPRSQRYYGGYVVATEADAKDHLDSILVNCNGRETYDNGRYGVVIDAPLSAGYVAKRFSENDYIDHDSSTQPANVDPLSIVVTRKSRDDMFNTVTLNYTDINTFEPAAVTVSRQAVIDLTEFPRPATYELAIIDRSEALRLGTTFLDRAWDDLIVRFTANREAMVLQPYDVIEFAGAGLDWQKLRILSNNAEGEVFQVGTEEYQIASYNDTVNNEDAPVDSNLPDPLEPPSDPSNCTAIEEKPRSPTEGSTSHIKIEFTPADTPFFDFTRISVRDEETKYRLTEDHTPARDVDGELQSVVVYINNPKRGQLHNIFLQTVSTRGITSAGVLLQITPVYCPPPLDVEVAFAPSDIEENLGQIWWESPPRYNPDYIKQYEVYDNFEGVIERTRGRALKRNLLATVPRDARPTPENPLDLSAAIHGDRYTTGLTFDVNIRVRSIGNSSPTVSDPGDLSLGFRVQWSLPAFGADAYHGGFDPRDVAFDGRALWVTNHTGDDVSRINRETGLIEQTITLGAGARPYGIAYSRETSDYGDIWVACFGTSTLLRVELDVDGVGTLADTIALGPSGPLMLLWDHEFLWISCYSTGMVKKFDPIGLTVMSTVGVGTNPCGMARMGIFLFVANFGSNTVSMVQVAQPT